MNETLKPPRREVAQEFYQNIIELGRMAHAAYLQEMKNGRRPLSVTELRELEEHIKICEAELEKYL